MKTKSEENVMESDLKTLSDMIEQKSAELQELKERMTFLERRINTIQQERCYVVIRPEEEMLTEMENLMCRC